ncbi:RecT family recombinase [Caloramator sp. Dgby_cultured_2]|uniref:RecT family recombinase n=1 Tax=Caloramator sp. Dgby_cultured_2 TaxID=3029174 RepID=UPI00237DF7C6|nr:RecT family recombinase [Caloramator sp. Dgby_cultured_2]WDU84502.1 recombinase RecT [Caloramator sp. Dgby_cultured_2]
MNKKTVAKGATDEELQMFLLLAQKYQLDPFAKEIWFIKYNNETKIMTSRDGYLKIAQNHPEYLGLISFVVCEGDEFEIDAANYKVNHKFGAKRGKIIGAWARCDRKGKNAAICFVSFDEYKQNTPTWNKYPSAMIQKVAEVFVLKRQFGISGLVTKEEIGDVEDIKEVKEIRTYDNVEVIDNSVKKITAMQKRKYGNLLNQKG